MLKGAQERTRGLLAGSWVVLSGVISHLVWVIIILSFLIPPLLATHEPPSMDVRSPGDPLDEPGRTNALAGIVPEKLAVEVTRAL